MTCLLFVLFFYIFITRCWKSVIMCWSFLFFLACSCAFHEDCWDVRVTCLWVLMVSIRRALVYLAIFRSDILFLYGFMYFFCHMSFSFRSTVSHSYKKVCNENTLCIGILWTWIISVIILSTGIAVAYDKATLTFVMLANVMKTYNDENDIANPYVLWP